MNASTFSTQNVDFDAESHSYRVGGVVVPSVTSIIKKIKAPFDADRVAKRVSVRQGVPTEAIIAEWERKRDAAANKGSVLHADIQAFLSKTPPPNTCSEFRAWEKWWPNGLEAVAVERILFDERLWLAGTMDALLFSSRTRKLHIFDWKTAIKFRVSSEYGDLLLPPFEDVPSCEFHIYSLQVSLYRIMAEHLMGEDCGSSWIVHVTEDRAMPYKAIDYRARLWKWLSGQRKSTCKAMDGG